MIDFLLPGARLAVIAVRVVRAASADAERARVLAEVGRHRAERAALGPDDAAHRVVLDELISELCDRLIDLARR